MGNYVSETAAGKSVSAYVIRKGRRDVATVTAHFGNGGRCLVNVRQSGEAAAKSLKAAGDKAKGDFYFQHASASGYGYDKFTSALSGLIIDGIPLSDHCGRSCKPPRGLKYFPADWKAPRGYSLANYGEFDASTGERRDSFYWTEVATAELGEGTDFATIKARGKEMRAAADVIGGYSSCYRREGLKYLEAVGYTVIQAL